MKSLLAYSKKAMLSTSSQVCRAKALNTGFCNYLHPACLKLRGPLSFSKYIVFAIDSVNSNNALDCEPRKRLSIRS